MKRRELLTNSAVILAAMALPTWASAQERYELRSFEEALASGPVVVHVYAAWCPVCRTQKPALAALAKDQALAAARFVTVDFDKDRSSCGPTGWPISPSFWFSRTDRRQLASSASQMPKEFALSYLTLCDLERAAVTSGRQRFARISPGRPLRTMATRNSLPARPTR